MTESVWIIYRVINMNHGFKCRKVEGVVYTEEQAVAFCENIAKTMDTKFGIDYQEWFMDAAKPLEGEQHEITRSN